MDKFMWVVLLCICIPFLALSIRGMRDESRRKQEDLERLTRRAQALFKKRYDFYQQRGRDDIERWNKELNKD